MKKAIFSSLVVTILVILMAGGAWAPPPENPDKTKEKRLPDGCADGQVAKWNADTENWECADDNDTNPDPPCFDNFNRYVDCGNGTVTDTRTGLIWLKDANCFGVQDWATANEMAAGLADGQCGLTDNSKPGDWRLPTIEEWKDTVAQAVDLGCTFYGDGDPPSLTNIPGDDCYAIGPQAFVNVQSGSYWSSFSSSTASFSLGMELSAGFPSPGGAVKTTPRYVWPVRGPDIKNVL